MLDVDHQSSLSFDKVLVTLSAGALGFSVSLSQGKEMWIEALKASWICFTVSLLAMLFSFRTARRDLKRSLEAIDWSLSHEDEQPFPGIRRPWYEVTTTMLNNSALAALILGICLLIAFQWINA